MLTAILYFFLPAGAVATIFLYKKQVVNALIIARYELIYWFLGTLAVGDDMVWGWKNKLKDTPQRTGDVAIVTGGARGIGVEVVKKLLQCDMTVVIACRNVVAGKATVDAIRAQGIATGKTDVLALDTASKAQVQAFADAFLAKYSRLHLLINNAGIMFVPYKLTEDGFELQLAVNHLGHFQLTHLLLPTLIRTGRESGRHARVVNVSSCAHIPGSINYEDINYERSLFISSQAYAQSKLAQILFVKALDRRLRSKKLPVSIFAIHPGVVNTELFDGTVLKTIAPWMPALFFKRPEQGAVTILHAALAAECETLGGAYLANCREAFASGTVKSEEAQEKLMVFTEQMLQIKDFGQLSSAK